jgi:hypothetical protein
MVVVSSRLREERGARGKFLVAAVAPNGGWRCWLMETPRARRSGALGPRGGAALA